jgi:hypothetical protein
VYISPLILKDTEPEIQTIASTQTSDGDHIDVGSDYTAASCFSIQEQILFSANHNITAVLLIDSIKLIQRTKKVSVFIPGKTDRNHD